MKNRLKNLDTSHIYGDIHMERVFYLPPQKKLDVTIKTDKEAYEPAETVELTVSIDPKDIGEDEKVYASIVVTDVSSFLQVQDHKLMPSLPAMVHLEREIKQPGL